MDCGQWAEQKSDGAVAHHTGPNPETVQRKLGPRLQRVGSYKTGCKQFPMLYQTNPIQTYPSSVQNLNRLTMTVDVDIYDGESQKVEIPAMPENSPIKVKLGCCLLLVPGRDDEDEEKGQEGDPSDARIPHSQGCRET